MGPIPISPVPCSPTYRGSTVSVFGIRLGTEYYQYLYSVREPNIISICIRLENRILSVPYLFE